MPLLKAQGFVADEWLKLGPEDELPGRGDIVVPWARLIRDWESLVKHDGRLGVVFPNHRAGRGAEPLSCRDWSRRAGVPLLHRRARLFDRPPAPARRLSRRIAGRPATCFPISCSS